MHMLNLLYWLLIIHLYVDCTYVQTAKTLDHMNSNVLGKYKIVTVAEAQVLLDEMVNQQETSPHDLSKSGLILTLQL